MKLARLAVLLALPTILASRGFARTVTIVITGTVVSGTDATGVFGRAGANLSGRPFTLTFSFDESNASTAPDCKGAPPYSPVICTSQRPSQSPPGIATLQIGDSIPFEFGVPSENVTSSATRTTWVSPTSSYRMTLGVGDGHTMVAGYVGSATPKSVPPMTANQPNAAWDYPFSDSAATSTPGISFTIDKPGANVSGLLAGTTLRVGVYQQPPASCDQAVAKLKQYSQPPGDPLDSFVQTQTCIAQDACAAKSTLNHPPWLDKLVSDFVDPFLNTTLRWSQLIANCHHTLPFGYQTEYCQYIFARHHIKVDLQNALNQDGCGTDQDWQTLANIITSCLKKTRPFDPVGVEIGNEFVQSWRDEVRQKCIAYRTGQHLPVY